MKIILFLYALFLLMVEPNKLLKVGYLQYTKLEIGQIFN